MKRPLIATVAALLVFLLPGWWHPSVTVQHLLKDAFLILLWLGMVAGGVLFGRRTADASKSGRLSAAGRVSREAWILGGLLLLISLSTFVHSLRWYFIAWELSFESVRTFSRSGTLHLLVLSGFFAAVLSRWDSRRYMGTMLLAILLAGQCACALKLWRITGGAAVYSDDHPSFLFRIAELWGSFPHLENYVPHWNAGVVNSVLVSSGTTGYAWLAAPFWAWFEPHEAHTAALVFVFILVVPWVSTWAFRTMGLGREGALAGGILMLTAGRQFFVWMLHFGTVGAAISWAMLPAALAFLFAVAVERRTTSAAILGLVFSMFFMVQWPPMMVVGGIMMIPALVSVRRWWPSGRVRWRLIGAGVLVTILMAHSLVVVVMGKDLLGFTAETASVHWCGWREFLHQFHRGVGLGLPPLHPLVVALGVAGVWVMPWKRLRWWTGFLLGALTAVFVLGPIEAPRLQLERMAIAAGSLAVLPTACWLRRLWGARATSVAVAFQSLTLALLCAGIANTVRIYAGQGCAPFTAMRPSVRTLAEWIGDHVPEDKRLLFAGPAVHAYGRGHVAYLPILTGREMMACDYYGFPRGMVEMDYPPHEARTRPGGLQGFMKLHGVSHVITYHQRYVDFFRSKPGQFKEVARIDSEELEDFTIFELLDPGGLFLEGSGTIRSGFNRWDIALADPPPETVVIAYNWSDRLRTEPPAEIHPHDTGQGATFIGIRPNGRSAVKIRYKSRF